MDILCLKSDQGESFIYQKEEICIISLIVLYRLLEKVIDIVWVRPNAVLSCWCRFSSSRRIDLFLFPLRIEWWHGFVANHGKYEQKYRISFYNMARFSGI
jgi:hypothetical protein